MHLMHGTARLRCIAPDYGNGDVDYHLMVCWFAPISAGGA